MPTLSNSQSVYHSYYATCVWGVLQSVRVSLEAANRNDLSRDQIEGIIKRAIRQNVTQGRVREFSDSLREIRNEGIDNTFATRICDYSKNIVERVVKARELGAYSARLVAMANIDRRVGRLAVYRVVRTYFKSLLEKAKRQEDVCKDVCEDVAIKKELKAFCMGLTNVNMNEFTKQCQWLKNKNAAQLCFEETTRILKPLELTLDPSKDRSPRLE